MAVKQAFYRQGKRVKKKREREFSPLVPPIQREREKKRERNVLYCS